MLLKDKVIIVTGVGAGMGRQMCRIAAAEGASVVVSARSAAFVEDVAAEIVARGGRAIAVPNDVSDEDQCKRLAGKAAEAFGRIDGLVNSARARTAWGRMEGGDISAWGGVMDVNCFGALRMSLAVLPYMKEQHDGAIVNVGTISTVAPIEGEADYAVAKAALGGLTRQMAIEFAKYNVRVNHTRMGVLGGPSIERFFKDRAVAEGCPEEEVIARFTRRIPLGVIPPDHECAKSVLFFLSDFARMVTGATLDINGGQYMAP